jgi:hypothetical protein
VLDASALAQTAAAYALSPLARAFRFLESPGNLKHGFSKHLAERAEVWEDKVPDESERAERMAIISECMETATELVGITPELQGGA